MTLKLNKLDDEIVREYLALRTDLPEHILKRDPRSNDSSGMEAFCELHAMRLG